MSLAVKRVYEPVAKTDGVRILVDRLWPRGLSKREAHIDLWLRDLAPSTALRKWFGHEPAKWKTFCARYRDELRTQSDWLATVKRKARKGRVTLLYGARDQRFNQAVALKAILDRSYPSRGRRSAAA